MTSAAAGDRQTGIELVFAGLQRMSDAAEQRRRGVQAEEAQTRRLIGGFASRLMTLYREAGEPRYKDLADEMRVSKATVSRILNGKSKNLARWNQVNALLKACGFDDEVIKRVMSDWIQIRNELKPIHRDDDVEDFD